MKKYFHYLLLFYIFELCSKMLIAKFLINTLGFVYALDIINVFVILLNICVTIYLLTRKYNLLKVEFFILMSLLVPCVITLMVNGIHSETIIHVITMLKFYPLIFIWRYIDKEFILKFSKHLKIISIVEIGIGLLQFFGGERVYNFFVPAKRYNQVFSVLPQDYANWNGDIFGSFEVQISYSYFIFFSFVLCNKLFQKKLYENIYFILTFIVLMLSGSTIILLAFLIYVLINVFLKYKINKYLIFLCFALFSIGLFLFYMRSIFDYFSIAYESNRLGIIMNLVPDFFSNQNFGNLFFGYGCEDNIIQKKIFSALNIPTVFLADQNTAALQDVYFVAHLFYFGFAGIVSFTTMIFYTINFFKKGVYEDENNLLLILYMLFPLLFVNQLFNIEVGNFFIYLIIGLLLFNKKRIPVENVQ